MRPGMPSTATATVTSSKWRPDAADETAARQVLADLERKAERVRAGLITPAEARTAEHLATPIGEHFDAYLNALAAAGSVPMHRQQYPEPT